ncbi:OmpH family outer membrane protein [Sediminibacterium ginsengisoli]|uniref:Periplasmic chaperone for outer membrane proteins Skp n=1 Tax=Sediminibacterium ginsengisoli TaxID=413434 RepID=A0A1T4RNA9_9BACT|nr:OmpH family outer membrane protein [Sediminibacterium ginsengisoli]SKA17161.1 periplasmic chaperone for outer membrane proteins Skp [Sediminibacterium ginsengisoli]
MKNLSIGFNIVLAAAIGVLFYLHFSSSKKTTPAATGATKDVPGGNFKIAYFEIDSLENQFEHYKEIREALQLKEQASARQLNEMKNTFAQKYQEVQRNAQNMTQAELASKQQELQQLDRTFQSKEQMLNNEMQDESMRKLQDVQKKIKDFLEEYNRDKGYAFILSNQSNLLYYKDKAYDITEDVIKGLNAKYKKAK